jgi:hypothetical protein
MHRITRMAGVVAAVLAVAAGVGYALVREEAADRSSRTAARTAAGAGAASTEARTETAPTPFEELARRPLVPPDLPPGGECPDPVSPDTFSARRGVPSADSAVRRAGPVLVAHPTTPASSCSSEATRRRGTSPARSTRPAAGAGRSRCLARRQAAGPLLVRGRAVHADDRLGFGRAAQPALALRVRPATGARRAGCGGSGAARSRCDRLGARCRSPSGSAAPAPASSSSWTGARSPSASCSGPPGTAERAEAPAPGGCTGPAAARRPRGARLGRRAVVRSPGRVGAGRYSATGVNVFRSGLAPRAPTSTL